MVRLSDLPDYEAQHLLAKNGAPIGPPVWVRDTRPLSAKKFALVTTAGIHPAGSEPFVGHDATYRVLPDARSSSAYAMSHSSVNFDRTGFQEDINVVLPVERFHELLEAGEIGGVAEHHFSFMGAGLEPPAYEQSVRQLGRLLRADGVDAAFLTPV